MVEQKEIVYYKSAEKNFVRGEEWLGFPGPWRDATACSLPLMGIFFLLLFLALIRAIPDLSWWICNKTKTKDLKSRKTSRPFLVTSPPL